jgi:hypothetical protein
MKEAAAATSGGMPVRFVLIAAGGGAPIESTADREEIERALELA